MRFCRAVVAPGAYELLEGLRKCLRTGGGVGGEVPK